MSDLISREDAIDEKDDDYCSEARAMRIIREEPYKESE